MPTHDQGYCFITALIFLALGLMHFVRFIMGWELIYFGFEMPFLWSLAVTLVCFYLALRGFRAVHDLFNA
ncbi:hypothetical protein N9L26_01025 [Candidatus Pacebacteria bacterium]|nr:hypothetical protein [Candidatus Paceibacterota bacterium]